MKTTSSVQFVHSRPKCTLNHIVGHTPIEMKFLDMPLNGMTFILTSVDYHYVGLMVKSRLKSLIRGMGLITCSSCAQSNGGNRLYWNEILQFIIGLDEIGIEELGY